jgi:2-phosphoglycolate phosphatase
VSPPYARAVVFDLDGTLIDSRRDIAEAANAMLREHGLAPLPEHEIAGYVGDGARLLVARAARVAPEDGSVDALLESFLRHYAAHPADHTRLMPFVEQVLDELSLLPLSICTNKPRLTTELVLGALGLEGRFQHIVAGGDLPAQKPDPAPLQRIAGELGLMPTELVMVGDGPQDVECARRAGARSVGVPGGILPRERLVLAQPDVLIESLRELPGIVRRWLQATSR